MLERAEACENLINADLHPDELNPKVSSVPNFEICVIIQKDRSLTKILLGSENFESCKGYGHDKGQDTGLLLF